MFVNMVSVPNSKRFFVRAPMVVNKGRDFSALREITINP